VGRRNPESGKSRKKKAHPGNEDILGTNLRLTMELSKEKSEK